MYQSYWNLQSGPFEEKMDATFFYESHPHQAGLLKLQYLVENRKGAGLLVGNGGIGKSYLRREYERALQGRTTPACRVETCRVCGVCKEDKCGC